jgi:hypothetical protein
MDGRRAQRNFSEAPLPRNLDEISQRPMACITRAYVVYVHVAKSPRALAVSLWSRKFAAAFIGINETMIGIPTNPGKPGQESRLYLRSLSFLVIAW